MRSPSVPRVASASANSGRAAAPEGAPAAWGNVSAARLPVPAARNRRRAAFGSSAGGCCGVGSLRGGALGGGGVYEAEEVYVDEGFSVLLEREARRMEHPARDDAGDERHGADGSDLRIDARR